MHLALERLDAAETGGEISRVEVCGSHPVGLEFAGRGAFKVVFEADAEADVVDAGNPEPGGGAVFESLVVDAIGGIGVECPLAEEHFGDLGGLVGEDPGEARLEACVFVEVVIEKAVGVEIQRRRRPEGGETEALGGGREGGGKSQEYGYVAFQNGMIM